MLRCRIVLVWMLQFLLIQPKSCKTFDLRCKLFRLINFYYSTVYPSYSKSGYRHGKLCSPRDEKSTHCLRLPHFFYLLCFLIYGLQSSGFSSALCNHPYVLRVVAQFRQQDCTTIKNLINSSKLVTLFQRLGHFVQSSSSVSTYLS